MNYCILNGKKSSLIKGLLIQSLPAITKPMIRTKTEVIDGRDGDITTKLGYSAYDKQMSIGLFGDFDIDEVIRYFDSEGIVVFSNEPDKFYKYKILQQINFERLLRFKTAVVTFHCQPFKFSAVDDAFDFNINLVKLKGFSQKINDVECKVTREVYPSSPFDDTLHIRLDGIPSVQTEFYVPIQTMEPDIDAGNVKLQISLNADYYPYIDDSISLRVIEDEPIDDESFGFDKLVIAHDSLELTGPLNRYFNFVWLQLQPGNRYKLDLYVNINNTNLTSFNISNKGNIESRPRLTIYGENNVALKVNGTKIFDIALASDKYITIDGEEMNAYKGDILKNRSVSGNYNNLKLRSGRNTISWTGTVSRIKVENASRWI